MNQQKNNESENDKHLDEETYKKFIKCRDEVIEKRNEVIKKFIKKPVLLHPKREIEDLEWIAEKIKNIKRKNKNVVDISPVCAGEYSIYKIIGQEI